MVKVWFYACVVFFLWGCYEGAKQNKILNRLEKDDQDDELYEYEKIVK